ncbi:TetR/AcrR family transcriptional regulator C-terminal ligand-binding domain-containing protein [Actinomadura barringtoniae]|uniref:TetR/AcrR family transcriptional regulator C-terminal ligand-binding domain-containing protein n=1 Tax=Actinomadura barringtoniae TaxID=1427535 RepID=A0A939T6U6_9ACTN|nr:TetR-like C-terminal domain-containing protein [Actinomadura barringtoniae]MBO2451269.1 TetR/AcrR family transcriptional regulator C-terminal ligand-binding domain-containing protein [Actinomadura barringtoniae]
MSPGIRRRGSELESAIFTAVIGQLEAVGYRKFTMEGVAAAAQTGKAALYRRWDSKEELIRDAFLHVLPSPGDVPAHEDIRSDLVEILGSYRDMINATHGTMIEAIKGEGSDTTGLLHTTIKEHVSEPLKELLYQAILRGVERGDVRPAAGTRDVAMVGPAMFTYSCMTIRPDITEEYVTMVVDEILMPLLSPR